MAKKRIKSEGLLIPIPNWEEADQIVRRMANLQNEIAISEMACAEAIDSAKQKMQLETADKHEHVQRYLKSLEAFCTANRVAFGKRQSRQLQFGTVGFRRSVAISVKKNTLNLIKSVFGLTATDYLNVKESPNKDALAKLADAELAKIGVTREEKEAFYVEPDKVESVHVDADNHNR